MLISLRQGEGPGGIGEDGRGRQSGPSSRSVARSTSHHQRNGSRHRGFPTPFGRTTPALTRVLRKHPGECPDKVSSCGRNASEGLAAVNRHAPISGHYFSCRQPCRPQIDRPVFREVDEVHRLNSLQTCAAAVAGPQVFFEHCEEGFREFIQ